MKIQEEVAQVIGKVLKGHEIERVAWVAAGGSNGGHWPAHYFMEHESRRIATELYTSAEFAYAPPAYVDEHTLAVVTSMRGTTETCAAARVAKDLGAATIALYVDDSELTQIADFKIKYESVALDESRTERVNSSIALQLAMALVNQTEGYANYDKAMAAFDAVDVIYRKAVAYAQPLATVWAERMASQKTIYVMGSGPAYGAAYIFSICNIEEMLQLDSPTINSCEFFHGPFEVVDKAKPIFLIMGIGRTRPCDERALAFLERYAGENLYVLDGKELGLNDLPDDISEYFNHVIFTPILNNVYMRALSKAISKDYMTRRYMWKVAY
ncbi:sugar isomerase [Coriobacteriales bacterium OH1046]|nr:sugar isomerase [Coriobacteriales bacterium OH1046]